jgi:hypothetical protein
MTIEVESCSYCGSRNLFVGRDGFLTCGECGVVLEEMTNPQPSYAYMSQSHILARLNSRLSNSSNTVQECLRVYDYVTSIGFADPAYCVIPLTFILSLKPAEAAAVLGMPEPLAVYAVTSFREGIPLNMSYGPKAFMPLRKMVLPREVDTIKLRLHCDGVMYVEFNGRIPLKPLYAGRLALTNPLLKRTVAELVAVRTRSGTVLCANVGCLPKQLPIKKRFFDLLKSKDNHSIRMQLY